jgi:hypothetical protein
MQPRLEQQPFEAARNRGGFVRHNQPGYIFQQRRDSAPIRDNYGSARGNGLRCAVSEIFILRWQHEYIRIAIRGPLCFTEQWTAEKHP